MAFRVHRFPLLSSTQIEAKNGSESGIYGDGDVIVAKAQSASYGRRGRAWQAPEGNLYFTMLETYTGVEQLGWLPYAAGLALFDAVLPFLQDGADLCLKWPNDVLIDKKKISGTLIEVQNNVVLTGIGLNVLELPQTDQPAASVAEYVRDDLTEDLTSDAILDAFLRHYTAWKEKAVTGGFHAIKDDWMARAAYINQEVTARFANGTVLQGVFERLDDNGALVLRTEKDHHTVTSADIFLNT